MKPTIRNIKRLVSKRKVIRGVNPFELKIDTLNRICDICVDEVQKSVVSKSEGDWDLTWKSMRVLTEEDIKNNSRRIPRLDNLIEFITANLHRSFPIKVSTTRNVGPEYIFLVSKKGDRDSCDWIHVPEICRFKSNKYYYKTFLHELGHAACSRNRLCLKFGMRDEEEVAVETTALILCFLSGINVWDDSIAYSQNRSYGAKWKKEDHILFVKTAKQWRTIRNKTKRILKYLLSGREKSTGLII